MNAASTTSRLFRLESLLNVEVAWCFDGFMPQALVPQHGFSDNVQELLAGMPATYVPAREDELWYRRQTWELIHAYYRITDLKQRRKIYELIKTMSEG